MRREREILEILKEHGPLTTKEIAEKMTRFWKKELKKPISISRTQAYLANLRMRGLIENFKGIKGIFILTEKGRKELKSG